MPAFSSNAFSSNGFSATPPVPFDWSVFEAAARANPMVAKKATIDATALYEKLVTAALRFPSFSIDGALVAGRGMFGELVFGSANAQADFFAGKLYTAELIANAAQGEASTYQSLTYTASMKAPTFNVMKAVLQ